MESDSKSDDKPCNDAMCEKAQDETSAKIILQDCMPDVPEKGSIEILASKDTFINEIDKSRNPDGAKNCSSLKAAETQSSPETVTSDKCDSLDDSHTVKQVDENKKIQNEKSFNLTEDVNSLVDNIKEKAQQITGHDESNQADNIHQTMTNEGVSENNVGNSEGEKAGLSDNIADVSSMELETQEIKIERKNSIDNISSNAMDVDQNNEGDSSKEVTIKTEQDIALTEENTALLDYRGDNTSHHRDSSSVDDSSDSSSSDTDADVASNEDSDDNMKKGDAEKNYDKEKPNYTTKTKGELSVEDLAPLEDLQITVPETVTMERIGRVSSIVGTLVIVRANEDMPALNMDTVLFLDNRVPMGRIFEVFGPVTAPFYSVRFNSQEDICDRSIEAGHAVFYAPDEPDFTGYVFLEQLRRMKGSDASWEYNNEPPECCVEYSDDEQERNAKAQRAKARKAKRAEENGDENDDEDEEEEDSQKADQKKAKRERSRNNRRGRGGKRQPQQGSNNETRPWIREPYSQRPPHHNRGGARFQGSSFGPGGGYRNPWSGPYQPPAYDGWGQAPFGRPQFNPCGQRNGQRHFNPNMQPPPFGFPQGQRSMGPPPFGYGPNMAWNQPQNNNMNAFANDSFIPGYDQGSGQVQNSQTNASPIVDTRYVKNNTGAPSDGKFSGFGPPVFGGEPRFPR